MLSERARTASEQEPSSSIGQHSLLEQARQVVNSSSNVVRPEGGEDSPQILPFYQRKESANMRVEGAEVRDSLEQARALLVSAEGDRVGNSASYVDSASQIPQNIQPCALDLYELD